MRLIKHEGWFNQGQVHVHGHQVWFEAIEYVSGSHAIWGCGTYEKQLCPANCNVCNLMRCECTNRSRGTYHDGIQEDYKVERAYADNRYKYYEEQLNVSSI